MKPRGARLQFQSQGIAPGVAIRRVSRAMVLGIDDLKALNSGKVMARLGPGGRQIVLPGAWPRFHHHKLPKQDCRKTGAGFRLEILRNQRTPSGFRWLADETL